MFGFGRKKSAMDRITSEMVYKLEDVNRRFPGVIPKRGDQVGTLALAIAMKVVFTFFDEDTFAKVLIQENSIEKDFPSSWTRTDALSRWYALGFICLTRCSMDSNWSDALTVSVGMQVYDATVEKMWILWSMPDAAKERVMAFMKTNIKSITSSLDAFVDGETRRAWFSRYAARIKGENPPWEIQRGGQSSAFEDLLSGGEVSADVNWNLALSAHCGALIKGIMMLATGADPIP